MNFAEHIAILDKSAAPSPVFNSIQLKAYFQAIKNKKLQGNQYVAEFNWNEAYIHILSAVNLILFTIPKHKDYMAKRYEDDRKFYKSLCRKSIDELQFIKAKIKAELEKETHTAPSPVFDSIESKIDEENNREVVSTSPVPEKALLDRWNLLKLPEQKIRRIVIPNEIIPKFLKSASSNTAQDIETCGILAGAITGAVLRISHVIIPKQKGSPNTVVTLCEEEMIEVQEKKGLVTLGWIHTHPSQTCFLSSVDMHTQFVYQVMIEESVAIVCSPKHSPSECAFWLTADGMKEIGECTCAGFHPHYKQGLFVPAEHAMWSNDRIEFVDLR